MEKTFASSLRTRLAALLCAVAVALGMALPAGVAQAASVSSDSLKATITVQGASEGDQFKVWKILSIGYDQASNALTYSWDADFEAYFTGKGVSVEDFAAMDGSEAADLLVGLPTYMKANGISSPAETLTVADGATSAVTAKLGMGSYFMQPISAGHVYQPMLTSLVPEVQNDSYVLNDAAIDAKKRDLGIRKSVANEIGSASGKVSASVSGTDSSAFGSSLVYTITADMPYYAGYADLADANLPMTITDTLPAGADVVSGTVSVKGCDDAGNEVALEEGTHYSASLADGTLTIDLSGSRYKAVKGINSVDVSQIVVTYKATLNDGAIIGNANGNVNSAVMGYSTYPYLPASADNGNLAETDPAIAEVFSYGIRVSKVQKGTSTGLAGAKFELYRDAQGDEEGDVVRIGGEYVTDEDGAITISGLRGGSFSYYLKEVAAPTGYALDDSLKPVVLDPDALGDDGYATITIENAKQGLTLPVTGSAGAILFALIGIAIMGLAILLTVRSRKAKRNQMR
ncbi:MAG: SpaH/EbpB family LPXTG-anchored major pilin [Eggerthellales bacterium]|nr:SpaH/EbpB family LPXTG-anchored major pilin [Eggerthellales bacterium]